MHLEIVTAERVVLSDEVDQVNVPTKDGRVGILPRHEPLLTILDVGELTIIKDGATTPFAVSGGFMEVLPNRVTIMAESAEKPDQIDASAAQREYERGQKMWDQAGEDPAQYERANELMHDAQARMDSKGGNQ